MSNQKIIGLAISGGGVVLILMSNQGFDVAPDQRKINLGLAAILIGVVVMASSPDALSAWKKS